jgi:hypothetical protein
MRKRDRPATVAPMSIRNRSAVPASSSQPRLRPCGSCQVRGAHRGLGWTSHEVRKVPKPEISPNAEPMDAPCVLRAAEDSNCHLACALRPCERTRRTTALPGRSTDVARTRCDVPVNRQGPGWHTLNKGLPRLGQDISSTYVQWFGLSLCVTTLGV